MGGRKRESFLHRPEFELYDLIADPHELRNVAHSNDALVRELQGRILTMMRETKDPWLEPIEREMRQ